MARPNGTTNKMRTPREKERLVLNYKNGNIGRRAYAKEHGISYELMRTWITKYQKFGIDGFKSKTGKCDNNKKNKIIGSCTSKNLTELEQKDLEIIKLKIENERLKNGYQVKGAGLKKEFITLKELNSKSLKN